MKEVPPRSERWRPLRGQLTRLAHPEALAGALRAAVRLPSGASRSPLAGCLLAAIALHLLGLSALQLRQRRQPAPALPPPRDDTPELLQFSRQQTREPAIAPLSIAALAQLPPPPPLTPTTDRPAPAGSARNAVLARASEGSRRPATRGGTQRPQTSARGPGRRPETPRRPAAGPGRLDPGLQAALTAIVRWQAAPAARADQSDAGWPAPEAAEGEQLALWKRLWEKASPLGSATGLARSLPAWAELRRLSDGDGEAASLPEGRRLSLAFGDRLLLVWPAGRELWLLQAPSSRPGRSADLEGDNEAG